MLQLFWHGAQFERKLYYPVRIEVLLCVTDVVKSVSLVVGCMLKCFCQ